MVSNVFSPRSFRKVNQLAWNDGKASSGWNPTSKRIPESDRLVGLHFIKMDVAHANADAALVLTALGVVIGRRIVVHGLAAVGLVGTSERLGWTDEPNRSRGCR